MGKKRGQGGKKKGSKKGKDPNGNQHQTESFKKMMGDAAVHRLKQVIAQQVQFLGYQLSQQTEDSFKGLYARVVTIEKLLMEKFEISKEDYSNMVADTEDAAAGLERAEEVAKGDLVRATISTKPWDGAEYQGEAQIIIEDVDNEPYTIGPELEPLLIGAKVGDVKEIPFGAELEVEDDKKEKIKVKSLLAKIEINRISRKPVVEEPPKEEKTEEASDAKEAEVVDIAEAKEKKDEKKA